MPAEVLPPHDARRRPAIGGHDGRSSPFGHAPEQATLWCAELNVLISADQVLPRITSNVGVWGNQPEANPLAAFLGSLARLAALPDDTLVLPSHERVFRGLHPRIAQLHEHHERRLERLLEGCATPITAHDALPLLFKRKLDDHQMMFAMGEAIAHLHYLHHQGKSVAATGSPAMLDPASFADDRRPQPASGAEKFVPHPPTSFIAARGAPPYASLHRVTVARADGEA